MNCYCAREFRKIYHRVATLEFDNCVFYCDEWLYDFAQYNAVSLLSNLIVVTINMIAQDIFIKISRLEK